MIQMVIFSLFIFLLVPLVGLFQLFRLFFNGQPLQPGYREVLIRRCEEQHAAIMRGDTYRGTYGKYPPADLERVDTNIGHQPDVSQLRMGDRVRVVTPYVPEPDPVDVVHGKKNIRIEHKHCHVTYGGDIVHVHHHR